MTPPSPHPTMTHNFMFLFLAATLHHALRPCTSSHRNHSRFHYKNSKKIFISKFFATKSCVLVIFSMHKSHPTFLTISKFEKKVSNKLAPIIPTMGTWNCLARSPSSFRTHVARSLSLSLRAVKHESVFYYNICVKESVFSNKFWNKLCSLKNFIYANRLIWIQYSWFSLLGNNLFPKIVKENKETVVREQAFTKGFTTLFFLVQRSMHWHFFFF